MGYILHLFSFMLVEGVCYIVNWDIYDIYFQVYIRILCGKLICYLTKNDIFISV